MAAAASIYLLSDSLAQTCWAVTRLAAPMGYVAFGAVIAKLLMSRSEAEFSR